MEIKKDVNLVYGIERKRKKWKKEYVMNEGKSGNSMQMQLLQSLMILT